MKQPSLFDARSPPDETGTKPSHTPIAPVDFANLARQARHRRRMKEIADAKSLDVNYPPGRLPAEAYAEGSPAYPRDPYEYPPGRLEIVDDGKSIISFTPDPIWTAPTTDEDWREWTR